jgi:hypothetical protein
MSRQKLSFALERFWSSSAGQLVVILGVVAAVWAADSLSGLAAGIGILLGIAFLWVHCIRPPLLYFRVSQAVFLFAAAWTVLELAFATLMIADEISAGLGISRVFWLAGQVISLAYLAIVGLVFWPKYSILIRLFGRLPTS